MPNQTLPVSGTSVGLIILLICSMDCKSGDKPMDRDMNRNTGFKISQSNVLQVNL